MTTQQDQSQYQTIKLRKDTHRKLRILAATTGESMLDLIDRLIDKEQERKTMKHIKTGETNDVYLHAVQADGRYYPLSKTDLNFESPDAKIYYDSGIYPGVTDLLQYICDKASE